ncbi:Rossmann-like domain-containing protein [candidate division CSSED10-310 bacterium]|uniref:Rossmann-like domain-containing protein n=1 Tax=candidate division CSSED10-310 bacterium TaxID=2855610 RepID=A0ABV6YXP9_UNCC1
MSKKGHIVVSDLRVGLRYTAVVVADAQSDRVGNSHIDESCGLAATLIHEEIGSECPVSLIQSELFTGKRIHELFSSLSLSEKLHRAIMLATCNGVINFEVQRNFHNRESNHNQNRKGSSVALVGKKSAIPFKGKKVGMVGFFEPLVPNILKRASSFGIVENHLAKHRAIDQKIKRLPSLKELEDFETVILTATSLINNTFDEAISYCRDSYVVVMGPSAPLLPEIFKEYPQVKNISGRHIKNVDKTLEVVSQGGGTPMFKEYTDKVEILL